MYQYVYCITKAIQKPYQGIFGFENADIHFLKYREIAAVVSDVSEVKIPASSENVLCHSAVVEAVQKEQTVLPVRFSSVLRDDEEVLKFLKKHYELFASDLERLQNKLEMGLRIVIRDLNKKNEESVKPCADHYVTKKDLKSKNFGLIFKKDDPCIDYLERRRIYYASKDEMNGCVKEVVNTCHAQFEGIYTEYSLDSNFPFLYGVSLNYLIYKDSLSEFKARFYDLMESLDEFWFLCSGPWPPYHFVSLGNFRREEYYE